MRPFVLLFCVLLAVTSAQSARADLPIPAAPNDPLQVELLTMGPGEHPFFKFGHNAIRIRDTRRGTDAVYNYGTFSFNSPTLLQDFFKGRLKYWLSRETMGATLAHYASEDRSLHAQRLALSPEQELELKRYLDQNARPENRAYKYDYFFDNCSTRLRDALNHVTGGQLREAMRSPATQSLRNHALRVTSDYFLEYLVLTIGLGPMVDRRVDTWAEAFLPEMLTDGVRHAKLRGEDGTVRPLVLAEQTLLEHQDHRLAQPPRWLYNFLVAGVLSGVALFGLAKLSVKHRAARLSLGVLLTLGGFVVGLLGIGLVSLWALTDHAVAYRNQNLLLLSPLALFLPWYGVRLALRGSWIVADLRQISLLLTASVALALALKAFPIEQQDNRVLIAFFGPCWAGLSLGSLLAARTAAKLGALRPDSTDPRENRTELALPETKR